MQLVFWLSNRLPVAGLAIGAVGGTLAYLGVLALSGVLSPGNLHAMLSGGMPPVHHPTPVDLRRDIVPPEPAGP